MKLLICGKPSVAKTVASITDNIMVERNSLIVSSPFMIVSNN